MSCYHVFNKLLNTLFGQLYLPFYALHSNYILSEGTVNFFMYLLSLLRQCPHYSLCVYYYD